VRVHRAIDVFARGINLFDREYEETLGYPALGRSGMVGVRVAVGR
jgi:outer membrane cobalamin receptor